MTINEVIRITDEIRPNIISERLKYDWVSHLDGRIAREIFNCDGQMYKEGEDGDTILLVPFPFDDIYAAFVSAQIDLCNNDIEIYNNDISVFNTRYNKFAKDYISKNNPKKTTEFKNVI